MPQDYQKLLKRVEELEKWKADRIRQQITYPLDVQSQTILSNYFMSLSSVIEYELIGALGNPNITLFVGQQGNYRYQVQPNGIFPYTVNVTSNVFTVRGGVNFVNTTAANQQYVIFFSSPGGAIPSPLADNTPYFVVNTTGSSFQVSATEGGAAINITDDGTGTQYISLAS